MKRKVLAALSASVCIGVFAAPASADHSNFPEIYPRGGFHACPAVAYGAGQHSQASEEGLERQFALYSDACLFLP